MTLTLLPNDAHQAISTTTPSSPLHTSTSTPTRTTPCASATPQPTTHKSASSDARHPPAILHPRHAAHLLAPNALNERRESRAEERLVEVGREGADRLGEWPAQLEDLQEEIDHHGLALVGPV